MEYYELFASHSLWPGLIVENRKLSIEVFQIHSFQLGGKGKHKNWHGGLAAAAKRFAFYYLTNMTNIISRQARQRCFSVRPHIPMEVLHQVSPSAHGCLLGPPD